MTKAVKNEGVVHSIDGFITLVNKENGATYHLAMEGKDQFTDGHLQVNKLTCLNHKDLRKNEVLTLLPCGNVAIHNTKKHTLVSLFDYNTKRLKDMLKTCVQHEIKYDGQESFVIFKDNDKNCELFYENVLMEMKNKKGELNIDYDYRESGIRTTPNIEYYFNSTKFFNRFNKVFSEKLISLKVA
jgi:hypothetical protein